MKETHCKNYELLAHHIVVQAMADYIELRRLREDPEYIRAEWNNRPCTGKVIDNEWDKLMKFFHSRWYHDLTDTDPDWLLEQLDKANIHLRDTGKFDQVNFLKKDMFTEDMSFDWCGMEIL